jgi:hypothetical protein
MLIEGIKWYFSTCGRIFNSPTVFFSGTPQGSWKEDALTFASATSWVISFILAFVIFVIQYIPIGLYLVEDLTKLQTLLVSPVLLLLSLTFFVMTLLIIGGFLLGALLGILYFFGVLLNFVMKLLGGASDLSEMVKVSFYSGVALLLSIASLFFFILAKYHFVDMFQLSVIENIVYYVACFYFGRLMVLGVENKGNVPTWKAVLVVSLPLIVLIFFGVVFHIKLFPKFGKYLA